MSEETLSNLSREERRFEPPAELAENANLKDCLLYTSPSPRDS